MTERSREIAFAAIVLVLLVAGLGIDFARDPIDRKSVV